MKSWKSFGASVIGPGHIGTGKPNQDAWTTFHCTWGDCVIVSDGLGSKRFSDFGSHAACRAVTYTVHSCRGKNEITDSFLADRIKLNWLSLVAPLEPRDCSATCLFAFRLADGIIRVGMLGDGLIAILKTDGIVLSLAEDKTTGFSNLTSALSENTANKEWRFLGLQEESCRAIVLCTDGVSDDLEDTDGFIREFAMRAVNRATISSARDTRKMLENWPVPKHSDDKTIACLLQEEIANE